MFNWIEVGKSNLADKGVEFDPCGPDTHRLHSLQAFNGIEVGKGNLADEGVVFDPCGPDTHRLHYEKLGTDALREAYDVITYEHDLMLVKVFYGSRYPPVRLAEEELPEGETHDLTLLGWGAARRHVHHVDAGPRTGRHGVRLLAGPAPLLQRADNFFFNSSI